LYQILTRLQQVCASESISYETGGLEAIIFTAEGDMRNALNALQSTVSGFGHVNQPNVFKVGYIIIKL
jgi:replication factor C subunit 2/4